MSKILVRIERGKEVECTMSEGDFWWVYNLAAQQGIKFEVTHLEGSYSYVMLPDAEAPRLVSLLECTVNEVLAEMAANPKDTEHAAYIRRCQDACRDIAAFTMGGGWYVLA